MPKGLFKYMKEFNVMYVQALNNVFDVTEQDVDNYISELKKLSEEAENADDVEKVIAQFELDKDVDKKFEVKINGSI